MEAQTADAASAATGSRTLADLLTLAVEKHAGLHGAALQGPGDKWVDVS